MTAIDRRALLAGWAGLAAGLAAAPEARAVDHAERELFAAARKDAQGRFSVVLFDPMAAREVASVDLPERGHGIAMRPPADAGPARPREFVAFARRPGTFAVVFNDDPGLAPRWLAARPDRHFFGHGIYSPDGRLLYTAEHDFESGQGVIGVRDVAAGYRQIGELTSGGIDPHEIALLSDGRTLAIANGGIKTHPDMPRLELELESMQPSLAYIDAQGGALLERHELPPERHRLSIRHLCVGAQDAVLFGCQFRGPLQQTQPVIGRSRRGRPLELLSLPAGIEQGMRNYVASLACDRVGETAVVTAPRGGLAVVIEVASGRYLAHRALEDVFGVAARTRQPGFLLASGNGALATLAAAPGHALERHEHSLAYAWDNHLVAAG